MDLNAKTVALVIGIIFVVIGLLGFVNNPVFGLFAVNGLHNIIHLGSGVLILVGAYTAIGSSTTLKIFGVIYALIAVVGFFQTGDTLFGLMPNNMADKWLHVVLAIAILGAGFALPEDRTA